MGPKGGMEMVGADAIGKKMIAVGTAMTKKVNASAVRKAAKPILAQARINCPVGDNLDVLRGLLRDSIGISVKTRKDGTVLAVIGPRRGMGVSTSRGSKGKSFKQIPTRYAHLVEFGTSHSAAKAFMRPAWDTAGGEAALDIYTAEVNSGLDKAVAALK